MKLKALTLVLVIMALCYSGYAVYEIKVAHPTKLIYTSVYGSWEFFDSRLPPLPFRGSIAKYELQKRSLSSYEEWPGFELLPYTVLALKDVNKYREDEHQKKLESIVDHFIDRGLSIDKRSRRGCTSLQLAVIAGDFEAIEFLRSRKASMLESLSGKSDDLCKESVSSLIRKGGATISE